MKYAHVINYAVSHAWAITSEKMQEIASFLSMKAAGESLSAEELAARFGDARPALANKRGNIAVIPLRGTITPRMDSLQEASGGMSCERFVSMLREAVSDESVGTIVLDIDSPGGMVVGVPEAAAAVYEARESKRIIAVANSMMCSAAYWIGCQAHEIYGHPSAFEPMIGNIGVKTMHIDRSEQMAKEGIKVTIVSAGKHKTEGSPTEPASEEYLARMEAYCEAAYVPFVNDVARARGVKAADVRNGFGEGRALSSKEAKAAGLIDKIGTLEDVIGKLTGGRVSAAGLRAEAEEPALSMTIEEPAAPIAASTELVDPFNELRERLDRY